MLGNINSMLLLLSLLEVWCLGGFVCLFLFVCFVLFCCCFVVVFVFCCCGFFILAGFFYVFRAVCKFIYLLNSAL